MFKLFEFKEGKLKVIPALDSKNIRGFFITSIIVIAISFLSGWLKLDEKELWKIYSSLIQSLGLTQQLPKIQDNQKKLDAEIELGVDKAIREYESWERSLPPRMTNKTILKEMEDPKYSDPQRLTVRDAIYYECPGGVMGIRGAWVDKDPNCH